MKKNEYKKMYKLEDSHFWFLSKRVFVDTVLAKHKNKIKNILDIGSGTGGMTLHLQKYGQVIGIEQNTLARKLAKTRNLDIRDGDAQNIKFKKNSFDLVTIFDVLYHKKITNDSKVIEKSKQVLKNKGLLLITDSAFNFLSSQHDISVHARKRYRLSEIVDLLEQSGFTIIKKSYIYFSLFLPVLVKRLVLTKLNGHSGSDVSGVPSIINKILLKVLAIEAVLLKYFSFPFGTSLLVLARKDERGREHIQR